MPAQSAETTLDADAVFIVTEWDEFKHLDLETLMNTMSQPIVFDGRNFLEEDQIRACKKIEYYPIGRPAIVIGMNG